jgi:o-succinylbenzoate synthase
VTVTASLARWSGRPRQVLRNAGHDWRERSGLVLTLTDELGHHGQGEASPLPGYSRDDFEGCRAALEALCAGPLEIDVAHDFGELSRSASAMVSEACPAARCALESALVDLLARRRGEPAWAVLRTAGNRAAPLPTLLPVAALLDTNDVDSALDSGRAALERGVTTFKLKLGRPGRLPLELEILRNVRAAFGKGVRLRLDANQSLGLERAPAMLEALAAFDPEFVEEPVADLALLAGSPVPLALDESLQRPDTLERLLERRERLRLEALVLKPMALGLVRCLELADRARRVGMDVVVSHLFDGPLALAVGAALALATGSPERAAGLDRHPGLSAWPALATPMISPAHVVRSDRPGLGLERLELPAG